MRNAKTNTSENEYARGLIILSLDEINMPKNEKLPPSEWVLRELNIRRPALVTTAIRFSGGTDYCICPNCNVTMEREYIHYCSRCGQKLKWRMGKIKYVKREERHVKT